MRGGGLLSLKGRIALIEQISSFIGNCLFWKKGHVLWQVTDMGRCRKSNAQDLVAGCCDELLVLIIKSNFLIFVAQCYPTASLSAIDDSVGSCRAS